jgi:hypothetical protein
MKSSKEILKDQTAPLMALAYVIQEEFGVDSFTWEPQLLRNELETKYDIKITDLQSDKIQAVIVMLTTDMYETDVRTFEVLNSLTNHNHQDFEDFEPSEAEEIVIGITEALLLKMEQLEYSDSVKAYAGWVFHEYGFCKAPDIFPNAIMPEGFPTDGDDKEKNLALEEIFNMKIDNVTKYMTDIK